MEITVRKVTDWQRVAGYEGLYEVNSIGQVRNTITGKVLKPRGRARKQNYLAVALYKDKKRKDCSVHRLVAEAFIPNPDNLPMINHKDENPMNNCVENLEWCDNEYNMKYSESTRLNNLRKAIREKESWRKGLEAARPINKEQKTWRKALSIAHERQSWKRGLAKAHENQSWKKANDAHRKPVSQYTLSGEFIKTYPSAARAGMEINIRKTDIGACCRGIQKTAHGYIWKFAEKI